jgi:hypothetical protein
MRAIQRIKKPPKHDLGFSRLYVKNGLGGITLPIDNLMFAEFGNGSSAVYFREEGFGVEGELRLG